MENETKTHAKWNNSELYSIGRLHYFGVNGSLYTLPEETLVQILEEIKGMNSYQAITYLIEQSATEKNRFKKLELW